MVCSSENISSHCRSWKNGYYCNITVNIWEVTERCCLVQNYCCCLNMKRVNSMQHLQRISLTSKYKYIVAIWSKPTTCTVARLTERAEQGPTAATPPRDLHVEHKRWVGSFIWAPFPLPRPG